MCTHPEKNPCTYPAYCSDGQGEIVCDCPPGMSGNGQKGGSGCQKNFPIDIAFGNLLNTPGITNFDYYLLFLIHLILLRQFRYSSSAMVPLWCNDVVQCPCLFTADRKMTISPNSYVHKLFTHLHVWVFL